MIPSSTHSHPKTGYSSMKSTTKRVVLLTGVSSLIFIHTACQREGPEPTNHTHFNFTTYAGIGGGHLDGDRLEARFGAPEGIAVDSVGNLYITEYRTTVVRKIDVSGQVTTLGGSGIKDDVGAKDGPSSAARFNRPHGIDVDSQGNVYVTDMHNHAVRKILPDGTVTTLAGKLGEKGFADGPSNQARFNKPEDVAVDEQGNVYVADTYNYTIRKITPYGHVSTLAGKAGEAGYTDGLRSEARFDKPIGIAVDAYSNLYVADANYDGPEVGNCVVRKITPKGQVRTIAGQPGQTGPDDGSATQARFHKFTGIDVTPDGFIYIADTEADTIRRITPGGHVTTLGGTYLEEGKEEGSASQVRFKDPQALTVDSQGRISIADTLNNRIVLGTPLGHP